jgi:dihydropyrimidinase/dihydroorotase
VEVLESTFPSETLGAVYGGVTTAGVFSWSDGDEPMAPTIEAHRTVGNATSYVDFFIHAVVTLEHHLAEMPAIAHDYGAWSFKHFFNANKPRYVDEERAALSGVESELLFRSLENVARFGSPAIGMVHCEDQDIIWVLEDRLRAAGRTDLRAWAEARPGWVETIRMRLAYDIARATGAPLYCVHIAAAEGVELMAEARRAGYPYWGETCPHYLTHTADMESEIGSWGRVNTAIKFTADQERLWAGIRDGSITNMGTDHSSFTRATKENGGGQYGNIWAARSGIAGGMEHWLPVMMTYGVQAGRISVEDMVRVCATNNAKVFGLYPRKGTLQPGADADIVLVDPDRETTITPEFYHCSADWSIYYGWKVRGLPRYTLVRGQVVLEEFGAVGAPGSGAYVVPHASPATAAAHR